VIDALVAFAFHAPGLRVFRGVRIGPATLRANLYAVAATLIAMGVTFALTRSWLAVVIAWLAGHVAWGAVLAFRVSRNTATR